MADNSLPSGIFVEWKDEVQVVKSTVNRPPSNIRGFSPGCSRAFAFEDSPKALSNGRNILNATLFLP